ncbi:MAG TPA: reverse transcriptase domain-containing protein, partial [Candidatus Babeliaceae bacterium]|nr:reverse transcriptase domain-containing protein [Candidatus Babeliaceae bacterium]
MNIQHKDHKEKINFYVTNLGRKNIIIGHSWLVKHNPSIDWRTSDITFNRCPPECGQLPLTPDDIPQPEEEKKFIWHTYFSNLPMKFKNPTLGIWEDVEKIPELRIYATTNIATEIEIENLKRQEPKTFETAVPPQYQMYRKVFEEAGFQQLPPRRPWDHAIEIKPDFEPQKLTKAYPLSPLEDETVKAFIEENLANGRIRPSKSPWASGFFFVKKKDGKLRPVQDYRMLNNATKKNAYPLPLIRDIIHKLKEAKYFTKMDVRWGFNNIRIKEGDEQKAAFLTPYGLFEPTVMFFGLCNSPATFQAMMNSILRHLIQKGVVIVYLDDILIYTKTIQEHREVVKQVLQILEDNNLYLKPEKCVFEQPEVEYLGMIIGNGNVRMDPKKVEAIGKWPTPKTVKDVQQFLGFCNFYRNFIENFANIAKPLWNLTQKDKPWNWTSKEDIAFDAIKTKLTSQPVLAIPNDTDPFRVECDASDYATGAILSQKQEGEWKPIAFMSKALSATERNYEIHDRELLAIIRSLEEWRQYLLGSPNKIEIFTDHKNLEYFLTAKKLNRRQARWSGLLADYDYILKHIPGKSMTKPDVLSRRPDHGEGIENDNDNIILITPEHIASITVESLGDEILAKLKEKPMVSINPRDKADWKQENGITYRDGLIVVNYKDLQLEILKSVHDSPIAGHPGQAKTKELITRNFWWSGLSQMVNKYVNGCRTCQKNKVFPQKPQGELNPNSVPDRPFQRITVDFIVKLPLSQGFDSIMVVTDRLTKRIYAIPCNETIDAEGTAQLFKDNVWRHEGFPEDMISDRGPQFIAKFMQHLCKLLGIKQNISSAYHPQTDGQTERTNQEIEAYLRMFVNWHQNDWSSWLSIAEFSYNNRVHSSTGFSPFFATKGYHVQSGITPSSNNSLNKEEKRAQTFAETMAKIHQETRTAMEKANEDMKRYYDRKHKLEEYQVGDKVWLDMKDINTGRPKKKLDILREGPFKITEKISNVAYR